MKMTINLVWNNEYWRWKMILPNGRDIGWLCHSETSKLFGITGGRNYKLRIRQTKTVNLATMVTLTPSYPVWKYVYRRRGVDTPFGTNVFISSSTDKFLTKTFGEASDVHLKIIVTPAK